MKAKISTLLAVLICTLSLTSLSSCTDDPETSVLIGKWVVSENNYGTITITNPDYDSFTFYSNGQGTYNYYNKGQWVGTGFTWTSYNNDYIMFKYIDGTQQTVYYRYRNGYLEMSLQSTFYDYRRYVPGA
ncbi:MAG: hypothetical protein PHR45_06585 [Muribaculaceae bacterium]|nr:hypothetical protein [Muribaculaceae bacterium]